MGALKLLNREELISDTDSQQERIIFIKAVCVKILYKELWFN